MKIYFLIRDNVFRLLATAKVPKPHYGEIVFESKATNSVIARKVVEYIKRALNLPSIVKFNVEGEDLANVMIWLDQLRHEPLEEKDKAKMARNAKKKAYKEIRKGRTKYFGLIQAKPVTEKVRRRVSACTE